MESIELKWTKSTFSNYHCACVELARSGDFIEIRDSKNPDDHLQLEMSAAQALIEAAKNGDLDHLVGP